ncbi:hypothetical protein [Streptomyces jumonjinensis]|uniref:hypothetical protein n=1 Tax=Streptomyces jumonjinensis TaxID=1945 RepID=UPI0037BDF0F5
MSSAHDGSGRPPFDSAGDEGQAPLPLVNNVWDLPLDGDNAARAGAPFTLAFKPATNYDATPVPMKDASLDVSYDGGTTWRAAPTPVKDAQGAFRTVVRHPAKAGTNGFVALRVKITDENGGRLEQTVTNACRLK